MGPCCLGYPKYFNLSIVARNTLCISRHHSLSIFFQCIQPASAGINGSLNVPNSLANSHPFSILTVVNSVLPYSKFILYIQHLFHLLFCLRVPRDRARACTYTRSCSVWLQRAEEDGSPSGSISWACDRYPVRSLIAFIITRDRSRSHLGIHSSSHLKRTGTTATPEATTEPKGQYTICNLPVASLSLSSPSLARPWDSHSSHLPRTHTACEPGYFLSSRPPISQLPTKVVEKVVQQSTVCRDTKMLSDMPAFCKRGTPADKYDSYTNKVSCGPYGLELDPTDMINRYASACALQAKADKDCADSVVSIYIDRDLLSQRNGVLKELAKDRWNDAPECYCE